MNQHIKHINHYKTLLRRVRANYAHKRPFYLFLKVRHSILHENYKFTDNFNSNPIDNNITPVILSQKIKVKI